MTLRIFLEAPAGYRTAIYVYYGLHEYPLQNNFSPYHISDATF